MYKRYFVSLPSESTRRRIMEDRLKCSIERYTAEIDAKTYIKKIRDAEYDTLADIKKYEKVRILGVKITPEDKSLPLEAANDLMKPVIDEMNKELLETEKSLAGMCFGFVGSCPYCDGAPCARIEGKPCKHPDKVRPSLEAYGFDISKTAKELLGLEIKWSEQGLIPEYLTLVCGIFY